MSSMKPSPSGYYTSQYLQEQNQQRRGGIPKSEVSTPRQTRQDLYESFQYNNNDSIYGGSIPKSPTSPNSRDVPSSPMFENRKPNRVVEFKPLSKSNQDMPQTPKTPNSLKTFFFGKNSDERRNDSSHLDDISSEADYEYGPQYDPDYLEQEITPAQLNYLGDRNDDQSSNKGEKLFKSYSTPIVVSSSDSKNNGFDGYYIQQKKAFDQADYKPKQYSHKTFRDIFDNKEESTDKYNPMEFVFDDGPKRGNLVKNVQVLFGKDDYNSYNYYDHKQKVRKNPMKEVFVKELSDDEDDDEEKGKTEVVGTDPFDEAELPVKKNKKLSKMFKKKIKKAKKELGKDFINNAEKQREEKDIRNEQLELQREQKALDDEEAAKQAALVAASTSSYSYAGQNPDFHPLWNYILSWVVYETQSPSLINTNANTNKIQLIEEPNEIQSQSEEVISPKPKNKFTSAIKTKIVPRNVPKNLKNMRKNYQTITSKWNAPAAELFNENYIPPPSRSRRGLEFPTQSSASSFISQDSEDLKEFVVEYDESDDESAITEELYYNPTTKQLEPYGSSTSSGSNSNSNSNTTIGQLHSIANLNSPSAIMSNINKLIKHIKIMKIIFAPIDIIAEHFPHLQTIVILIELVIFMWILYELSLLIDALCMMVKAVCAPMIAMGRFMNRIM
ncbi:hypothetical protein DFJ63DRAFT_14976 [Scheffersomyces coipomensis]|uniref:uncharacterized protein n=1 Tax=Scheffersomyces coipomensis TaxID=1788519 RepID=UPI00315D9C5C